MITDDFSTAPKCNLLGVGISATTYDHACAAVLRAARERRSLTVTALAVHGVMTGALDPTQRTRLNAIDLVVPDGQPVKWGINFLNRAGLKDRVRGPTLMLRLCEMVAREGLSVALYGGSGRSLARLRDELVALMPSRFCRISPAEQVVIARQIASTGADLVFVGLGCPRQEVWLYENAALLDMPMIAVGAAFDFHAKLIAEAPLWMQDRGLEWLYRLGQEPRRLWRRYLLLNPLFLCMLALQKLRLLSSAIRHPGEGVEQGAIQHVGYA